MKKLSNKRLLVKEYFYKSLFRYLSIFIGANNSVVEVNPQSLSISKLFNNSKTISLHNSLNQQDHYAAKSNLEQLSTENPDYLILNSTVHYEKDILLFFHQLHKYCSHKTRIIILYYSSLWKPLISLASFLRIRTKTPERNWVDQKDISDMLSLADFELIFSDNKIIIPIYIPLLSNLVNRYIAPLPFFRALCMVSIISARPLKKNKAKNLSVSTIVPARNEAGNIKNIVKRIPQMGPDDEIIFVEGHSTDSTWEEIQKTKLEHENIRNILCMRQDGHGKADAVRKGFKYATKDILMILDADLSVSPEALKDFHKAMCEDKAEFLNGSRLVYPHDGKAMKFCNMVGNKGFAIVFSFLMGQRLKDTLCGTKVLSKENYDKISLNRSFFGDFDPFGDFDLILGASRLCLKIREIPVRYYERTYGTTNIKRWKHGLILLRMAIFAGRKIKFI